MIEPHFPGPVAIMCGHVTEFQAEDVDRSDVSSFHALTLKTLKTSVTVLSLILWLDAEDSKASEEGAEPQYGKNLGPGIILWTTTPVTRNNHVEPKHEWKQTLELCLGIGLFQQLALQSVFGESHSNTH